MLHSEACTSNVTHYAAYSEIAVTYLQNSPKAEEKGVSVGAILSSVNLPYRSCQPTTPPPLPLLASYVHSPASTQRHGVIQQ